ncbi:alpha/beta hydrolase [Nocardia sp. NPDC052566]|uniref:alpha/beta hydrolase n=1 Tax=Nocardia sp. NPDC052566 TaxID=3364330 RepID=UPI0037C7915B
MRTSIRSIAVSAAVALVCLTPGVVHADPASSPDRCQEVTFPVAAGTVAGTLCLPPGGSTDTVMVLMAGSNYNHTYWDFPYAPETYNFRRAMNAAGYATLVADRLGNGASSRPPSLSLTAGTTANALHDIVQTLRHGIPGAQPFAKIVTGGHSLSSGTSLMEGIWYRDVDGILLTGYSHAVNAAEALGVISTYYPAIEDPLFAGRGLDPGYVVSRPGTRLHHFFVPDNVDPQVLTIDEETKETFSLTEYPDGLAYTLPGMSSRVDVPVMVTNGSLDRLSCGIAYAICRDTATLQAAEAPFFSPAARLRTYVLPDSGHSLNLARNTADYQRAVIDWMKSISG